MPVDVVVGGQKGDEGKGKVSAYLALKKDYKICMRISGPNAGHTISYNGKILGLATLPCGYINEKIRLLVGRGAYIDVKSILIEIGKTGLKDSNRLGIDGYATIITDELKEEERSNKYLMSKIESVGTGLGPTRRNKIMRNENAVFAKDVDELKPYITDTVVECFDVLAKDESVLLEGDQGFCLSLIHGEYPFVTSRDTTASTFLGEAGLGPRFVRDVYIIFKPYATRVASGPLKNETKEVPDWFYKTGREIGTVSGRKRRIGEFEWDNALRAIRVNSATKICMTHMDVYGDLNKGKFPEKANEFIKEVSQRLEKVYPFPKLNLISYGPEVDDIKEL